MGSDANSNRSSAQQGYTRPGDETVPLETPAVLVVSRRTTVSSISKRTLSSGDKRASSHVRPGK